MAVLRERIALPAIDAPFAAVADLPVPLENDFYDADANQPLKTEAFDYLANKFLPLPRPAPAVQERVQ